MRKKRVHIIGAGFSGLTAGFYFLKDGFEVVISESDRVGGLIQTEKSREGPVESAAHSFLATPSLLTLFDEVGASVLKCSRESRKRFVAQEAPRLLGPSRIVGPGLTWLFRRIQQQHRPRPQENLFDWGTRVLGASFSNQFLFAATQGIWGATADQLSAELILSPWLNKDHNHPREKRSGSTSSIEGMGPLLQKIAEYLKINKVDLRFEKIKDRPDADIVVLATSGAAKTPLLEQWHPGLARNYREMKFLDITRVTLFSEPTEKHPWPGFGIIFDPRYKWKASGLLFNTHVFPEQAPASSRHPERKLQSESWIFHGQREVQQLPTVVHQERERLGLEGRDLAFHSLSWSKVLPLYSLKHQKVLAQIKSQELELALSQQTYLLGNEMGEIGLASLGEASKNLARRLQDAQP